jgi:hypothetical protein
MQCHTGVDNRTHRLIKVFALSAFLEGRQARGPQELVTG